MWKPETCDGECDCVNFIRIYKQGKKKVILRLTPFSLKKYLTGRA